MESLLGGNLSLIIFFPLVGIPLIVLFSYIFNGSVKEMKWLVLGVTLIEFIISIPLFTNFEVGNAGMQFVSKIPWCVSAVIHLMKVI